MDYVIPKNYYTYNAAGKAITLLAPYNTTTAEQVSKIRNLSSMDNIYNRDSTGNPITVLNGVISHTADSHSHTNNDTLLIVVDTKTVTVSGTVTVTSIDGGSP